MAFLAGDGLMQPGEGKPGAGVIEARHWPPGILRVATDAVCAQLAGVPVLMAGKAVPAQAEVGAVHVLELDVLSRRRRQFLGVVATRAVDPPVFALQRETGLGSVVEAVCPQACQGDAFPGVFNVAASAIALARGRIEGAGVQARPRFHSAPDLTMTFHALETARPCPKLMTGRAPGHSFQFLMRL